jgi:hypothetical protein
MNLILVPIECLFGFELGWEKASQRKEKEPQLEEDRTQGLDSPMGASG